MANKFLNDSGVTRLVTDIKTKVTALLVKKIDEPASEGSNGQALITDGNGGRSWKTVATDQYITSTTDDLTVTNKKLGLASKVTTKLSALNNTSTDKDKVLTANGDGTSSWKLAKGGHDMVDTIDDVLSASKSDNKVVNANTVAIFSNTYKVRLVIELTEGMINGNCMGDWEDTAPYSTWFQNNELIVADNDDDVELQFMFQVDDSKPVVLGGYKWETELGKICIKFGNEVEAGTVIAIDIVHTRRV